MSDGLKPCPFCGGEKAHVLPCNSDRIREDRLYPIVRCMGCYLDLPGQNDDFSANGITAAAAWNNRATTPAEAARVLLDDDDVLDKITLMILGKKTEHTPNLDYVAQRVMKKSDWCKQVEAALRAIADGGNDE